MANEEIKGLKDYQYGFADKDTSIYKTKQGLTKETVLEISKIKNEISCSLWRFVVYRYS